MPTQSRGFWTCDYCRQPCDTFEEAKEHELTQCPHRSQHPHHHYQQQQQQQQQHSNQQQQQQQHQHQQQHYPQHPHSTMGAPPPQVSPYFQHHPPPQPGMEHHMPPSGMTHTPSGMPPPGMPPQPPAPASMTSFSSRSKSPADPRYTMDEHGQRKLVSRSITLLGPRETSNLAPEDAFACSNIEFFEATPEQAAESDARRTGGVPVVPGQVGLRCAHCAQRPLPSAVYNMVFPGSLGSIAANVRMVADQHLTTCGMVPNEIQEACERAAAKRKADLSPRGPKSAAVEEHERCMMLLMDFCMSLSRRLGVVDKQPPKMGIEFSDTKRHHGGAMETPGPRGGGYVPMSAERPGYGMSSERMSYPTPTQPSYSTRAHYPGSIPQEGALQPTPLQTRRERPGDSSDTSPPSGAHGSPGYPPYAAQGPMGGDGQYPPSADGMGGPPSQMPPGAEQGGDGCDPSAAGPAGAPGRHGAYYGQPQQPDSPSNFPYYQDASGSWQCKYCAHVHPQYREPQSIWSTSGGAPPPGSFIDQHLTICRSYHQSAASPSAMYQGGPPHYGSPYGGPPGYGGWDPHNQHPSMPGYPGGQDQMSPYMQYPGHQMESGPHGMRYPEMSGGGQMHPAGPHSQSSQHHPSQSPHSHPLSQQAQSAQQHQSQQPPHHPQQSGPPFASAPNERHAAHLENAGDTLAQMRNYLIANEKDEHNYDDNGVPLPKLVFDEDRLLLTDYFFHLMKQLRVCRFSESDRKTRGGKREKIKIGYGGLQCVHCADVHNSRKFFWSNVDRLANSFAEIPGHILKCRRCSQQTKDALRQLKQFHPEQMARLPRGSQKVFFRRMWRRLHKEDPVQPDSGQQLTGGNEGAQPSAAASSSDEAQRSASRRANSLTVKTEDTQSLKDGSQPSSQQGKHDSPSTKDSEESNVVVQRSYLEAAKVLASASELSQVSQEPPSPSSRTLLAIPEDKDWLSDVDCFVRKQLEVFCAIEQDVKMAKVDKKQPVQFGQVGIRCIHCSLRKQGTVVGHAVSYPFSINSIYEAVREFQRLHLDSCDNVPEATQKRLNNLKGSSSLSSVLRRYYTFAAQALGLKDTKDGIRAGAKPIELGPKAIRSFAERHPLSDAHLRTEKSHHPRPSSYPPASAQVALPANPISDASTPGSTSSLGKRKGSDTNLSNDDRDQKAAKPEAAAI